MMAVMPLVITMVMLVEKEGGVVSKAGAYLASCPLLTNDNTTHSIVIILAISIIIIITVGMVRVIEKATNSRTKLKSKNIAMCRNISHSTCSHHRMMTAKSLQS